MATVNQKVDHLNKLTMIAITSKDAYIHTANKEVCEFINALKSEGYKISEGDELDVYTDYEMCLIDRLTANCC
jgi:maleate cis-trans isomerase